MRRFLLASGLLALAAVPALASGPSLSGTYLLAETELCPVTVSTTTGSFMTGVQANGTPAVGQAVTAVQVNNPGSYTLAIGTAVLTPATSGGSTGTLTVALQKFQNALLLTGGGNSTGFPAVPSSKTQSGTYSATNAAITVTFAGQSAETYAAQFGAPLSGVVRSAVVLGAAGGGCTDMFVFTHQ